MATYDPPQPMWKRIAAGILDFLLAFFGLGSILGKIFPTVPTRRRTSRARPRRPSCSA